MTWLNIKLSRTLKKITSIEDVILFGSAVRGKEKPTDIDVLVLFKNKIDKEVEYFIRKELEKYYKNLSIISKTKESIEDPAFDAREAILMEGISLITGKKMAENFGLMCFGIFKYDFENWSKLNKTKFYYALNGRGDSLGIMTNLQVIKLADGILMVPLERVEAMKEFLASWHLSYKYFPLLIPNRLAKKSILEK